MRAVLAAALLFLSACATTPAGPAAPAALDVAARDYVSLILELGEREPGYVDAYYGPPEWAAAAKANPRTVEQLQAGAVDLIERLQAVPTAGLDADQQARRRFLIAHSSAAAARLRMIQGEKVAFADEAEALFDIRPVLKPLTAYDPVLAELEALLPGSGPLSERADAFLKRYEVPESRQDAVMRAAIAECRRRTVAHIQLPANERFDLAFVKGKSWSGYNYYKGDAKSLIEINTELPVRIDRAVDLGCHEGYPGHHVYNALLEKTFVMDRGWMELSVYPLYSPMSFIAEGSANYGIELAFPGDEALGFEQQTLYPLAGLDPATAPALRRYLGLTARLDGVENTIAADFLGGRISEDEAVRQLQKYTLASRVRAEQRVRFVRTYRSYVINYNLGRQAVRDWVARQGPNRWDAMERLLSSQMLPSDLVHPSGGR
ncbi:hypothetical protein [Hyalangium rubrum]|uniref:DUF885 domain-containing protein n=1 Tax=Hyalangium rubrum TaxID=3103134 RepID=A0ABU5H7T9_9BACT|nr:hypothetical protein [Hyalangium sp. s54d21]MDY7229536.1 hypothetical protein [Hyalangium sp. s54d21]